MKPNAASWRSYGFLKTVFVSYPSRCRLCTSHLRKRSLRILQIGTKANKNIIRLAEALSGIPCELHIVGPLEQQQEAKLHQHKIAVTNHMYLTDEQLLEQYKQADIVSFVSTHEGFGMPVVEAQSVERVCVTSNCSSMPEVAGAGACFVDPFDVQSIRAGFQKVISDGPYRQSLVAAGRQNKLRFDSQRIADDFLQIYKSICNGSMKS
jgi:glycosyltransferase involved in cell wall biosynthesis